MKNKILKNYSWTHWQWYRDFFNITVFKYLVTWFAIVPVFAKLLIKLPSEIILFNNNILTLSLPFKWECLWLSSVFFLFAYIIYIVACPSFIKKYFSLKVYLEYEHSPRWLTWETKKLVKMKTIDETFIKRMSDKKYIKISTNEITSPDVVVSNLQSILYFKYENKNYEFGMPILTDEREDEVQTRIAVREVFWEIFGRFSSSKPKTRIAIIVLLFISLAFFSIAFLQSLIAGFEYLIS